MSSTPYTTGTPVRVWPGRRPGRNAETVTTTAETSLGGTRGVYVEPSKDADGRGTCGGFYALSHVERLTADSGRGLDKSSKRRPTEPNQGESKTLAGDGAPGAAEEETRTEAPTGPRHTDMSTRYTVRTLPAGKRNHYVVDTTIAFHAGIEAAATGGSLCPYTDPAARELWRAGYLMQLELLETDHAA